MLVFAYCKLIGWSHRKFCHCKSVIVSTDFLGLPRRMSWKVASESDFSPGIWSMTKSNGMIQSIHRVNRLNIVLLFLLFPLSNVTSRLLPWLSSQLYIFENTLPSHTTASLSKSFEKYFFSAAFKYLEANEIARQPSGLSCSSSTRSPLWLASHTIRISLWTSKRFSSNFFAKCVLMTSNANCHSADHTKSLFC